MSKVLAEYVAQQTHEAVIAARNEAKIEEGVKTILNMLKRGMSLEMALECTELDLETYEANKDLVQ